MSDTSREGICLLLAAMPPGWGALVPWLEQLMEESLGKGGTGGAGSEFHGLAIEHDIVWLPA